MDEPTGRPRRRVWLPTATVRASLRPDAPEARGRDLAERTVSALAAGGDRTDRDARALAELEDALGPGGIAEWLVGYPGLPGVVGAAMVLAPLAERAGDLAGADALRAAVSGDGGGVEAALRHALDAVRGRVDPQSVDGGVVEQASAVLAAGVAR